MFNLLHEPTTGLIINGEITDTIYKSHHAHRLAKIGVISPEGGMVAFNTTTIETFDSNGVARIYTYDFTGKIYDPTSKIYTHGSTGIITVEDIEISINSREKFRHYGATFTVAESTFSIAIKGNKNSLRFEIDHEHHIKDEGIEGLLGFTMAKSYSVSFFTGKIFHYNNLR